jgi:hypothetical protein
MYHTIYNLDSSRTSTYGYMLVSTYDDVNSWTPPYSQACTYEYMYIEWDFSRCGRDTRMHT